MATLATIQTFAIGNPALKQRFQAGRLQNAWNITTESVGTTNHAPRLVWAKKIFENLNADVDYEYNWWLANSTVQTSGDAITDAQIVSTIAALVDSWT